MPIVHTSELSAFVEAVNSHPGAFVAPEVVRRFSPLDLAYDTYVDQELSPYSDEYYNQQLTLYSEISGRILNQQDGELHPVDISQLLGTANPIGLTNVEDAGEHVRSLSTMLSLSSLTGSADVLDMGAGHGLSSEIFAFAGCRVHAIDIDPVLGNLSRKRAAVRGLDIVRSDLNFDDLSSITDDHYAAAYFFQSLHHCLRPWELIERLKTKLTSDGVIGFVGEPINTYWWKHWGIRLDEESLFVARAHGWFESGWSHNFIRDCFARNGMDLKFYSGGHVGGQIGMATLTTERSDAIAAKARLLGLEDAKTGTDALWIDRRRYASLVGTHVDMLGLPAFRREGDADGVLLYGPYMDLAPGSYEISVMVMPPSSREGRTSELEYDIVCNFGAVCLHRETFVADGTGDGRILVRSIRIDEPVQKLEVRASITGPGSWTVGLPTIARL